MNCTHIIPDGVAVWFTYTIFITLPAPFVIPSSVLVLRDISVLSPIAKLSKECSCLVFLGSLGTCFKVLSLSSRDSAPMTLSCALMEYLVPDRAFCALSLNSFTFAF